MAHNVEPSNNKTARKAPYPPQKPKTPDKNHNHPANNNTPPSQSTHSSPALSYVSTPPQRPSTPPQSLGKRHHGQEVQDGARPPPNQPQTPHHLSTYSSQNHSSPPIDPLQFQDALRDGVDQTMERLDAEMDEFLDNLPQDPTIPRENTELFTMKNKELAIDSVRENLRVLTSIFKSAADLNQLNPILEDVEVEEDLAKLVSFLPGTHTNYQLKPILAGILDLQKVVGQVVERLDKLEDLGANPNKSLRGSIHAPTGPTDTPATHPQNNTPTKQGNPPRNNQNPKPNPPPTQAPNIPLNPNASHHPSRLVAQFLPNGVPPDSRPDPCSIVPKLNAILSAKPSSKHLKIVAANFNNQGNLILSTRADQTASDLLKHADALSPSISRFGGNREVTLREDKKWFKIQIDGVNTGSLSIGNGRITHTPEAIHAELLACNPHYHKAQDLIVSKPRWLRTVEELSTTTKSSLVFALSDEPSARTILSHRSLAAFGRHCPVRAFQDRPPVTQCRNCWSLEHMTPQCKDPQRCRLCSGPHDEMEHPISDPASCNKCSQEYEAGRPMDPDAIHTCPHDTRCPNCLPNSYVDHNHPADARRCPARLHKYGTARENERRAMQSDNPWIKAKHKKPKPKTPTTPHNKPANHYNRFDPLNQATPPDGLNLNPHPEHPQAHSNLQEW